MILTFLGTVISYLLTMILLPSYIDFWYIIKGWTALKVFSIALINWLPFFIYVKAKEYFYPEKHEKLNLLKKSMIRDDRKSSVHDYLVNTTLEKSYI